MLRAMKRIIVLSALFIILLAGVAVVKREPLILGVFASKIPDIAIADHENWIAPHIEFRPPATGTAPFPTVLMFHGCAGLRQGFMDHWSAVINEAGYMAVLVDSHAPRNIDYDEASETVCQGKRLLGQERAGDLLAAYRLVRENEAVDQTALFMAGWSHGAWSIMDLLTMDMKKARPAQLQRENLTTIKPAGAILFYPYCGVGTRSRFAKWQHAPETLAFVAGADTIVNGEECLDMFKEMTSDGLLLDLHYYPSADHVFDDPTLDAENFEKYYNEKYATAAVEAVRGFLLKQKEEYRGSFSDL